MNTLPLVSIIIDNYNYGHFLRNAIDSALQQTYQPIEVIVVDDGSTDGSQTIIQGYGNRVIPVLKENAGQASAFNAGVNVCHGDIIILLDADDLLLPDVVQRVVPVFVANSSVVKVQYRMEIVDSAGVPTGMVAPPRHVPVPAGDLRRHALTAPFDLIWMPTSGNAFSAQALKKVFPVPEQHFPINADLYVTFTTLFFGDVVALQEVGAYYRVHHANHFALSTPTIDLPHLRETIAYLKQTRLYIKQMAERVRLPDSPGKSTDMLSVYLVAARLVSLKLERKTHPIVGDTVRGLLRLGITAVSRRFDLSAPMKGIFILWFLLMVPAPPPLARWLALRFLFPQKRNRFNKVLGRLHRRPQNTILVEPT